MKHCRSIVVTTASALAAVTLTVLPNAAARRPPTRRPAGPRSSSETFTGSSVADPAWTVQGDTCLTGATSAPPAGAAQIPTCAGHRSARCRRIGATPGYLQLTDASTQTAGSVLYNRPIPATAGVTITFDQYQYGGTGADGIGFFLVDGATDLTDDRRARRQPGLRPAHRRGRSPSRASRAASSASGWTPTATSTTTARAAGRAVPRASARRRPPTGAVAPNVITLRGPGDGLHRATATSPRPRPPDAAEPEQARAPRSTAAPGRCAAARSPRPGAR